MPLLPDTKVSPLGWANDVLWAAERGHLKYLDGRTKGRPSAAPPAGVTQRQFGLWQFAQENPKEMQGNLVPKAIAIVRAQTGRDDDEELAAAEDMEVGKMWKLYEGALVEAHNLSLAN